MLKLKKKAVNRILIASILNCSLIRCPLAWETLQQQNVPTSRDDHGLVVEATTDKASYHTSESMILNTDILNESDAPISVFGMLSWGPSGSLELFVSDLESKQEISPNQWPDAHHQFPADDDFIRLNPGHSLGAHRTFSLEGLNINKPGHFRLEVAYHAPFSQKATNTIDPFTERKKARSTRSQLILLWSPLKICNNTAGLLTGLIC